MVINSFFIVGAGFTKAVYQSAPLNSEFLTAAIGTEPNDSPLGRVWSKYGIRDVEVLLTEFDLDLMASSSSSKSCKFSAKDRDSVNNQLAEFVKQFRFKQDIRWLHPFVKLLRKNDIIASVNYDCFLEGFLDFHEVWSPRGGYHIIRNPLDDSLPRNVQNIRILKLHGSESFRLTPFLDKPESVSVGVEINPGLFPRSGQFSFLGGGVNSLGPYIIAPSFVKNFVLEMQYLMINAIAYANVSRNLIIIGCGIRQEDNHLWLIIISFLKNKLWRNKRIIIVDPNAADIAKRIKQYWGRNIFNPSNLIEINNGLREGLSELGRLLTV